MHENHRESFRIAPDSELDAELFHEGRVAPCQIGNLSAGGARLTTTHAMSVGHHCTLGVRLKPPLSEATPLPYVSFHMEVLEATPRNDGTIDYRLRGLTAPGSPEYEAAAKLVFEAQRRLLAHRSGADESSDMVSDHARRKRFWNKQRPRFSRGSMRPDQRPD